jgi:hypothetical protein
MHHKRRQAKSRRGRRAAKHFLTPHKVNGVDDPPPAELRARIEELEQLACLPRGNKAAGRVSRMIRYKGHSTEQPHVGEVVIFTDEHGNDYNALVNAVFGEASHNPGEDGEDGTVFMPCLNAVWISADESKQDMHGRQIERDHSSIVHATSQPAHGVYWRWPGDPKNPIMEPTER